MPKKTPKVSTEVATALARKLDAWGNILTGLGVMGRDKRTGAVQTHDALAYEEIVELYRGDDLAATIVDAVPDEMTREGFEVAVQAGGDQKRGGDAEADDGTRPAEPAGAREDALAEEDGGAEQSKEQAEAVMASAEEFDVLGKFNDALKKRRAFGGGAILVGADDGEKDLRRPLREDNIRSIRFLTTLDARELIAVRYYNDPLDAKYGDPKLYRIQPQTELAAASPARRGPFPEVHESRVLRFDGVHVSRRTQRENYGWGDSILVRCNQVLQDYNLSWGSVAHLLQDFSQGVFKMKGLADALMANDDQSVLNRMQLVDMSRSVARMMVLDAEDEDFERKTTTLAGLADVFQQMALRLAATARMPVMVLLGQPPTGLNATGSGDMQWWHDRVAAMQRTEMRPQLNRFLTLLMKSKRGPTKGVVPDNWQVKFNPLTRLSDSETADMRLKVAQADALYMSSQAVTPEEIGASRFGGDGYSLDTVIDLKARREMSALRDKATKVGLKNAAEPPDESGAQPQPGAGGKPGGKRPPPK